MGISKILFAILVGVSAPYSFGLAISGTPTGVSAYTPAGTTTSTGSSTPVTTLPIIYGGTAGDAGCPSGTADGVNTCNTCTGASTPTACNTARIYDSLYATIPLTETGSSGTAYIQITSTTGAVNINNTNLSLSSVTFKWGDLCSNAGMTSGTCVDSDKSSIQATIYVDTDGNQQPSGNDPKMTVTINVWGYNTVDSIDNCSAASGTGVCWIDSYPGDAKIYIRDATGVNGFPSANGRKITKLRVFANSTSTGWNGALPGLAEHEIDMKLDDNGDLVDKRARGLANGVGYFIRIGQVDAAGNLDAITSNTNISSTASGSCGSVMTSAPTAGSKCIYYVKPDEVYGLLTKDMNCFIATAAFGTSTSKYLDLLREFRFKKLIPFELGRKFVFSYYKYGPYGARYIVEHPWTKPMVQAALWPVIGFSWLVLQCGWMVAILIYACAAIIFIRLAQRTIRAF